MESISQVTSMENLKFFSVDLQDPTKMLQVGNELNLEDEQKLKDFLLKNMYVYAWRHEDMVGIYPKIDCHHFKIDQKFTLYI